MGLGAWLTRRREGKPNGFEGFMDDDGYGDDGGFMDDLNWEDSHCPPLEEEPPGGRYQASRDSSYDESAAELNRESGYGLSDSQWNELAADRSGPQPDSRSVDEIDGEFGSAMAVEQEVDRERAPEWFDDGTTGGISPAEEYDAMELGGVAEGTDDEGDGASVEDDEPDADALRNNPVQGGEEEHAGQEWWEVGVDDQASGSPAYGDDEYELWTAGSDDW